MAFAVLGATRGARVAAYFRRGNSPYARARLYRAERAFLRAKAGDVPRERRLSPHLDRIAGRAPRRTRCRMRGRYLYQALPDLRTPPMPAG